ncbi:MAG: GNAT family N-acetyltransferase [Micromonosporaceae bacterium]|nr:GNAT family N-acetyltransferase [Micromonosporaceae bacterium]
MRIEVDDLTAPEIAKLLTEHLADMAEATPDPRSRHALDLDGLRAPGITVWSVWDGDKLVGCGALKRLDDTHAEVKSMRTVAHRRRSGVASTVLTHIIEQARSMGYTRLSLETGSGPFYEPARKLYERFGFTYCEPFADYRPDPNSVFMTRTL